MSSGPLLAAAIGGAIGALVRGQLLRLAKPTGRAPSSASLRFGSAAAIVAANAIGCLLLGDWLARAPQDAWPTSSLDAFVVAGLCGGLTTFSTLCSDAVRLHRTEGRSAATAYLAATIFLGIGGLWLGLGFPAP